MKGNKKYFFNGKIIGVGSDFLTSDAMIIEGNKFLFFGAEEEAVKFVDGNTKRVDLQGKIVTPKFIDAHLHLIEGGLSLTRLDLSGVKSKSEFQEKLYCYSKKNSEGWIIGGGWSEKNFRGRNPDKSWIDKVISKRPVVLIRMDFHTAWLNSKALEIVGITNKSQSPAGGEIEFVNGEPTGIIKDEAFFGIRGKLPKPSVKTKLEALQLGIEEAKKYGVSGVHEMLFDFEDLEVYKKYCEKEPDKDFMISISVPIMKTEELSKIDLTLCDNIKIVGVKGFADGSLGAQTAWFFDSYKNNPQNFGLATAELASGELERKAMFADRLGLQISVHAIGDRAVHEVLNLYERLRLQNGQSNIMHRVEHAQHVNYSDIKRFPGLGLIASMQPFHFYYDKEPIENLLGNQRLAEAFPVKELLASKTKVVFGTDFPVVGLNPTDGIKTISGKFENKIGKIKTISIDQAIKAYTKSSSEAARFGKGYFSEGEEASFNVIEGLN